MINLSFTVGPVTLTPLIWSLAVAAVLSSYSIWKKLREDYSDEVIFTLTLQAGILSLIFSRLFFILLNFDQFDFSIVSWLTKNVSGNFAVSGAFIGAVIAVNWKISQIKKSSWEVLDSLCLPVQYFLVFGGLGSFLTTFSFPNLLFCLVGVAGIVFYPLLKKKYRSFAWYKSGKTGFLFSLYSLYTFSFLLVLAFFKTDSLYLNRLILLFLILASLSALYIRSEREIGDDIKAIIKRRKK